MARQLVESLAAEEFEPEKYHDEYREQVLDLIDAQGGGRGDRGRARTPRRRPRCSTSWPRSRRRLAKSKTAKERHPSGTARARAAAKPAAAKRATKSTAKAAKAPAKKAARAKRSA